MTLGNIEAFLRSRGNVAADLKEVLEGLRRNGGIHGYTLVVYAGDTVDTHVSGTAADTVSGIHEVLRIMFGEERAGELSRPIAETAMGSMPVASDTSARS